MASRDDGKYATRKGFMTSKGWKGKKYYLSDEAVALLDAHCRGTPYSMSAALDLLIKQALGKPAPAPAPVVEPPLVAELRARTIALERGVAEANEALRAADERARRSDADAESRKTKQLRKDFDIDV